MIVCRTEVSALLGWLIDPFVDMVASVIPVPRLSNSDKRRARRLAAGETVVCPVRVHGDAAYCVPATALCVVVAAPSGMLARAMSQDGTFQRVDIPAGTLSIREVRPVWAGDERTWPRFWHVIDAEEAGQRVRFGGSPGDIQVVLTAIRATFQTFGEAPDINT